MPIKILEYYQVLEKKKKNSSGVLRHEQKLVNYCTFVTIVYGKYIEEIIFIISL